jgi:hypothetical protein
MRATMERRSGLQEGLEVTLRHRKPIDIMSLYDWAVDDLNTLMDAWSRVWYLGTQAAIDAADSLVSACNEVLELAVTYNSEEQPAKRRLHTYVVGLRWNQEEQAAFQAALTRTAERRAAFVQLMRKELGQPPVELAIERALARKHTEAESSPLEGTSAAE